MLNILYTNMKYKLPKCDKCHTNKHVISTSMGMAGHGFYCRKCKTGWEQAQ